MDITVKIIYHKKETTATKVKDIDGTFVVKLRGLSIKNDLVYTQLPLNEDDNNFDEKFNDINYKITAMKLHDAGLEKQFFTSTDAPMLG